MKKTQFSLIFVILFFIAQLSFAGEIFKKSEYEARRSKLIEKIPDGVAIILSATTLTSDRQFYQNNDFFYFCGVEIPNAVLIIDAIHKESILFFSISEEEAEGEGISLNLVRNPREVTGIEKVFPIDRFSAYLSRLSFQTRVFYTMFKPEELNRENTNEKFGIFRNTITMNIWDG